MNATGNSEYAASIERLEGLYHGPILPVARAGLRRIEYLLARLDNPHRAFRSVHIAGSSGKGSTTSIVGSILRAAGFRTGVFRSPHLVDYTERIAIDGKDIDRERWVRGLERIWPIVEGMRDGRFADYKLGRPSFSEVLFALMSLHFARMDVEWASVETGLGGRLDATNVLQPDVAVITNISLEHTNILGNTIAAIAGEKAAIIKPGADVVTASDDPEALAVIERHASEAGDRVLCVGREITVEADTERADGQEITLRGKCCIRAFLPVAGRFQVRNAATAFGAIEALRERGVVVSDEAIVAGLSAVRIPGRLEVLSCNPTVVLDGAHHPAAISELMRNVERLFPGRGIVVLFAAMADKDIRGMAVEVADRADRVILTPPPSSERAATPEVLAEAFVGLPVSVIVERETDDAWRRAQELAGPDDVLLVTGSLYLIGYLRHMLLGAPTTP